MPEIHAHLIRLGVALAERTVTNLLDRYDELLAVALADDGRLRATLQTRGRVVLAIDGLQPDVGHEVLWVLRDVLSGEILLARSLLSARNQDLAAWFGSLPVVAKGCTNSELLGASGCATNGYDQFDKIAFWKTPQAEGGKFVPYSRWTQDYIAIMGGR